MIYKFKVNITFWNAILVFSTGNKKENCETLFLMYFKATNLMIACYKLKISIGF